MICVPMFAEQSTNAQRLEVSMTLSDRPCLWLINKLQRGRIRILCKLAEKGVRVAHQTDALH